MILRIVLIAVFIAATAAPAHAQSRRDLTLRIDALQARLDDLERGSGADEDVLSRLGDLEREQRSMLGEIERLQFENRRLRDQLDTAMEAMASSGRSGARGSQDYDDDRDYARSDDDDFAADMADEDLAVVDPDDPFADARRGATRPLGSPESGQDAPRALGDDGSGSGSGMSADDLYQEGRSRLLDGDFEAAQDAFAEFTAEHEDDPQAGEAWYWLGETHFVQGRFEDASDAYLSSLRTERRGPRSPDALVRLGASLAALGDTEAACDVLTSFQNEYPDAGEDSRRRAEREASRAGCR